MKLTIERAVLMKSLGHVQNVVERRTTIPILSNVRIDAGDGFLGLTATDMDISFNEKVAAEVATSGVTTASAHMLYDIVRKLPDGAQVDLEIGDGDQLALTSGRSRFSLPLLSAEEFPVMTEGELTHHFSVPAANLRRLIDKTRFAISTEETRYYLNGIYLHAAKGDDGPALRAVATDGHRLSRVDAPLPDGAADMPGVIVPRKTVNELRKLIDEVEGDISVSVSDAKIRFSFGDVVLLSKLIDGSFPDYERVIPSQNDKTVQINGKALSEAVDRVATISTDKTRSVKLALDRNRLVISANSPESGSASEDLEVEYDGPELQIGFNSRYLLDVTERIDGDKIQFVMADSVSPTILRDSGDSVALYVLMPMRV